MILLVPQLTSTRTIRVRGLVLPRHWYEEQKEYSTNACPNVQDDAPPSAESLERGPAAAPAILALQHGNWRKADLWLQFNRLLICRKPGSLYVLGSGIQGKI